MWGRREWVSRLAPSARARGRLRGTGALEIGGRFEGEVDWRGTLRVLREGKLAARGRLHELELNGEIDGFIDVGGQAILRDGARWTGGGRLAAVTCERGASLEGEFHVEEQG